jgi:hypothetical protein
MRPEDERLMTREDVDVDVKAGEVVHALSS